MVKKIIDILLLLPFAIWLALYDWPDSAAGIISTIALLIFSAAAGITVFNMIGGRNRGSKEE